MDHSCQCEPLSPTPGSDCELFTSTHDGHVPDTTLLGPYTTGGALARAILHNIEALAHTKEVGAYDRVHGSQNPNACGRILSADSENFDEEHLALVNDALRHFEMTAGHVVSDGATICSLPKGCGASEETKSPQTSHEVDLSVKLHRDARVVGLDILSVQNHNVREETLHPLSPVRSSHEGDASTNDDTNETRTTRTPSANSTLPSSPRHLPPSGSKIIYIHVGAQPNNSPHAGTITVFATAFALCRLLLHELKIRSIFNVDIKLQLDLVDTAPDNAEKIDKGDGLKYQRSHRKTGGHLGFLPDYQQLLDQLSDYFGHIEYRIQYQRDLMRMPGLPKVLRNVLSNSNLATEIAPEKETPALRRACPVKDCGIADKHGVRNQYKFNENDTIITFHCPDHGPHTVTLEHTEEVEDLGMNTPLRNLVRTLVYDDDTCRSRDDPSCDVERLHTRVTGSDYAGFYQEQLLWRQLHRIAGAAPPVVLYAPLITDWAGSKLSKSLYVKNGAYGYMQKLNMTKFLSYAHAKETATDWTMLFAEVKRWLDKPGQLFRPRSVDYIRLLFEGVELTSAIANQNDSPPGTADSNLKSYPKLDAANAADVLLDNPLGIHHDGEVHDPLGAGSYVFDKHLEVALLRYLGLWSPTLRLRPPPQAQLSEVPTIQEVQGHVSVTPTQTPTTQPRATQPPTTQPCTTQPPTTRYRTAATSDPKEDSPTGPSVTLFIHLDARPDSDLSIGNVIPHILAYILGRRLRQKCLQLTARSHEQNLPFQKDLPSDVKVVIQLDVADVPPQILDTYLPKYIEVLQYISNHTGSHDIELRVATSEDQARLLDFIPIVRRVLEDRVRVSAELFSQEQGLGIGCVCPVPDCNYIDMGGKENVFTMLPAQTTITFNCPRHATYSITLEQESEAAKLRFAKPLRDLIRALLNAEDTARSRAEHTGERVHMHVVGSEYAGFYQEQLLWRQLFFLGERYTDPALPVTFYAPLILDWSGGRLSRSASANGAYGYMKERGMEYLLSLDTMKQHGIPLAPLIKEVEAWVGEPKKLFRPYSIEYLHRIFGASLHSQNKIAVVANQGIVRY